MTHDIPASLSDAGAKFIGHFEGFRSHLYNDAADNCTIGCGHLAHMGPCNGKEPEEFEHEIDEATDERLLRHDAQTAANAIRSHVRVGLSQPRFDALVSFVYNVGAGNFENSTRQGTQHGPLSRGPGSAYGVDARRRPGAARARDAASSRRRAVLNEKYPQL